MAGALLASLPFSPSAWRSVSSITDERPSGVNLTSTCPSGASIDCEQSVDAEIRKSDDTCLEMSFWLLVGIVNRFKCIFEKKIPGFDRFRPQLAIRTLVFYYLVQVPPCV